MNCVRFMALTFVSFACSGAVFGQELNLPKFESAVSGRGHIRLGCTTCHSVHKAQGGLLFTLAENKKVINPATKQPFEAVSALCLACHSTDAEGGLGMLPVSASHSHPMSREASPKVANVSDEFLREKKLECVGCHDPHASNTNWALLRVDTKSGTEMDMFCAMCHAGKADPTTVAAIKQVSIFSSMDETKPPAAQPNAPAVAPAKPPASGTPPASATPPAKAPAKE